MLQRKLDAHQKVFDAKTELVRVRALATEAAALGRRALWIDAQAVVLTKLLEAWTIARAKRLEEDPEDEDNTPAPTETGDEYVDEGGVEEEEIEIESLEDGRERLTEELTNAHDEVTSNVAEIADALVEDMAISVASLNADRPLEAVRADLDLKLRKYLTCRASLLLFVVPISGATAELLISRGYNQLSAFGYWCPVQLYTKTAVQPTVPATRSTARCRDFIYHFSSLVARTEFMEDPEKFLTQPPPPPVVPIRLAIVGPPAAGKSTLTKALATKYSLKVISVGSAVRHILDNQKETALARTILDRLAGGGVVPDDLAMAAVLVQLSAPQCHTSGFVFDGFPIKETQMAYLTAHGIVPGHVLELSLPDSSELSSRIARVRETWGLEYEIPASEQAGLVRTAAYEQSIAPVREGYTTLHRNWVRV